MAFTPSSPVTGTPQTGFTSPTYTFVADTAPNNTSKQFAVSSVGGTQTGVEANTVSSPFTFTCFKPAKLKGLPQANPITGLIKTFPKNIWKFLTRHAAMPAANQPKVPFQVYTVVECPAGVDTYEPEELRAALSFHFGMLYQQSAGIGDMVVTGIMN